MGFTSPRALVVLLTALIASTFTWARADAQSLIHLKAGRIAFYYDRFLLEADGNVRVTTDQGITMTGDAFSMDLRLNRFVIAGHVHVASPSGAQDGAALADFFDFNRVYFVPVTAEPDRWTFLNNDFAHPAKGREMPGDTFALPDLSRSTPFLTSTSAVVSTRNFVRFGSSVLDVYGAVGLPLPSYYLNFSTNQHMGVNSLSGATYDATYQFAGGANSISALHGRYDPTNNWYLSFEQHLASQKAYAVFSVNPATRPSKFWNLELSDQPTPHFQISTFTQLHTFQFWLTRPLEASQFTSVQMTQALPHSFVQLTSTFVNQSLLGRPPNGLFFDDPSHTWNPDHGSFTNLGVSSYELGRGSPLRLTYRYGMGVIDDLNLPYKIWSHYLGFTLYTPSIDLSHREHDATQKDLFFNAAFDKQRTWYSVPHHIDQTSTTASLSRIMDSPHGHVTSYLQYSVGNVGDYYGAAQRIAYPVIIAQNGVIDRGYAAFRGFATFRTLSFGTVFANGSNFALSVVARKHNDFPAPVPGFFTLPPTDIFGRYIYTPYFGQPPYDLTADVRMRLTPTMSLDVSRTYYFNFGGMRWSPRFVIQVLQ